MEAFMLLLRRAGPNILRLVLGDTYVIKLKEDFLGVIK